MRTRKPNMKAEEITRRTRFYTDAEIERTIRLQEVGLIDSSDGVVVTSRGRRVPKQLRGMVKQYFRGMVSFEALRDALVE